jgi:Cu+-exporting ATPase
MMVDPHTTPHPAWHGGRTSYFCSAGFWSKFEADPTCYIGPATAPVRGESVPDGTIYTYLMGPEIRQSDLGSCPICGIAVEPLFVDADTSLSKELIDMTCRPGSGLPLQSPSSRSRWLAHTALPKPVPAVKAKRAAT